MGENKKESGCWIVMSCKQDFEVCYLPSRKPIGCWWEGFCRTGVQRWKHSTVLAGDYCKRTAGQEKGAKTKGKTLHYHLFLSCPTWITSLHQGIWWSLDLTQYTAYKTPKKQQPLYSVVFFTDATHKKYQSCSAHQGCLKTGSIINTLAMNNKLLVVSAMGGW